MAECRDRKHTEWIKQIVDQQVFSSLMTVGPDYSGEVFKYCPFCGNILLASRSSRIAKKSSGRLNPLLAKSPPEG